MNKSKDLFVKWSAEAQKVFIGEVVKLASLRGILHVALFGYASVLLRIYRDYASCVRRVLCFLSLKIEICLIAEFWRATLFIPMFFSLEPLDCLTAARRSSEPLDRFRNEVDRYIHSLAPGFLFHVKLDTRAFRVRVSDFLLCPPVAFRSAIERFGFIDAFGY
jgi:hypothetical protein